MNEIARDFPAATAALVSLLFVVTCVGAVLLFRWLLSPRVLELRSVAMIRGDDVEAVQLALADLGLWTTHPVDGIYGPHTARAVARFQRQHGMFPTGAVDARTGRALRQAAVHARKQRELEETKASEGRAGVYQLVRADRTCTACLLPFFSSDKTHTRCFACRGELGAMVDRAIEPPQGAA